ncbi:MAG: hypothetical protein AB7N76_09670 [Planctomycetota bacterium]
MSAEGRCGRCQSPLEQGDLRCAICGETAPAPAQGAPARESLSVLRCKGCGAAMAYDAAQQAPACAFCDAVLEVEVLVDPLEQTERYLPFAVDAPRAEAALRAWWGQQGFFRVQDLPQRAQVETLTPLWWVGWVFSAEALISWTADSDAGAGRSGWAPHAGQSPMRFDRLLVSASRGLTREETHALAQSYALATGLPQPQGGGERPVIEQFDVQRSLARARIAEAIEEVAQARVAKEHVPGARLRKLHVTALLRGLTTNRYAFPAYVLAYRYGQRLYRVVISGQDASHLTGESPLSWTRILLVAGAVLLVLALVLAAVLAAN